MLPITPTRNILGSSLCHPLRVAPLMGGEGASTGRRFPLKTVPDLISVFPRRLTRDRFNSPLLPLTVGGGAPSWEGGSGPKVPVTGVHWDLTRKRGNEPREDRGIAAEFIPRPHGRFRLLTNQLLSFLYILFLLL
jgi:hypothetical protein